MSGFYIRFIEGFLRNNNNQKTRRPTPYKMQRGAFALSSSSEDDDDEDDDDEEVVRPAAVVAAPPATAAAPAPPPLENVEELRFRAELEFVQLLASPTYLHYLAQYEYLEDEEFLSFLEYLQYWRRPRYAAFIEYPECLNFLKKLSEDEQFRKDLKFPQCRDKEHHDQFYRWRNRYFEGRTPPTYLPEKDDDFGAATYGLNDENIQVVHDEHPVNVDFDLSEKKIPKADRVRLDTNFGKPSGQEIQDKWWLK